MELVVATIDELQAQIGREFDQLARRGPLACGLSGGATALIFLGALRSARADWSRVSLYWVDERAVPPDHTESNVGLARRMLIDALDPAPRVFPMPADHPDLDEAALQYDLTLDRELGGGALDLVILGVGEDGHVASLFPGHHGLVEHTRVVAVRDSPKPPRRRLSLSMPFLLSSQRIWIVAVGARKRAIVQGAVARTSGDTPFDMVVRHGADVTIFTDQPTHRS